MRRLIVLTICATCIFLPVVPKAATLGKLNELERRFNDYDRRLTGVERKIELLLNYVRKGQGAVIDRDRVMFKGDWEPEVRQSATSPAQPRHACA